MSSKNSSCLSTTKPPDSRGQLNAKVGRGVVGSGPKTTAVGPAVAAAATSAPAAAQFQILISSFLSGHEQARGQGDEYCLPGFRDCILWEL